ncbi:unnamed protein product, partial [Scytosiphon promiscuus]
MLLAGIVRAVGVVASQSCCKRLVFSLRHTTSLFSRPSSRAPCHPPLSHPLTGAASAAAINRSIAKTAPKGDKTHKYRRCRHHNLRNQHLNQSLNQGQGTKLWTEISNNRVV